MGKKIHDNVLDGALDVIRTTSTNIYVCSQEPSTISDARSYSLASGSLASDDFVIANGTTSGRKITMATQSDLTIATTATADHIALGDGTNVLLVTTCTAQALTSGNTVTVGSFKDEIADPS
jgi:hypothetical protein